MNFFFARLAVAARRPDALVSALASQRKILWATFTGLFGLPMNQVIAISHGSPVHPPADAEVVDAGPWQPTARPTTTAPLSEPGLYVLRHFAVAPADVDEFVALSSAAWPAFEGDGEFATLPRGLFHGGVAADGTVSMQLVTWYDSFASWERSRAPAPQAAENFRRRHALTRATSAMALRLADSPG